MKHLKLRKAKSVYKNGGNITEFLRKEFRSKSNTSEIIEIAYDLQAGSYIDYVVNFPEETNLYAEELHSLLAPHLSDGCSILDVGTGELTTLTNLVNRLDCRVAEIFAFDISWSRLHKGLSYWNQSVIKQDFNLSTFVADIKKIPMIDKSVDIAISSHALEPNGKSLTSLLSEIFRVSKNKCVFFEPSYEYNSRDGKQRMDKLGYIKDMEGSVKALGGKLIDFKLLKNPVNKKNPTACFVISPPVENFDKFQSDLKFSVPGTNFPLKLSNEFMVSEDTGLVFPILDKIPVLKEDAAILATGMFS